MVVRLLGPQVGLIRWPAQDADRANFVANYLGAPAGITATRVFTDYGHRAPSIWSPTYSLWGSGVDVQANVNADILAAEGAADFFAYNWYPFNAAFTGDPSNAPPQSGITLPSEAHFTSPYKTRVKAIYMIDPAWWSMNTMPLSLPDNWGRVATYRAHLVAKMQDPAYYRFGGRPVLGIYGYAGLSAGNKTTWLGEVDALQTALNESIWIAEMSGNTSAAQAHVSRGCRWKFNYGPNPGPSGLTNGVQYSWASMASADIASRGWLGGGLQYYASITPQSVDQRPRNTGCWWIDQPTMPELVRHLSDTFAYTQSGFGTATPEMVMGYAWDELDEGGPGVAPTIQERRRYRDALEWVRTGRYPESYLYELDAAQLNFTKSGTWTKSAQTAGMYNGDEIVSSAINDYVDFTHERCRHLGVLATKGPDRGIADVSIDGVSVGPVDLYASTTQYQQQVYMSPRLDGGTHSIRIRDTDAKNASSSSKRIGYDACRIIYNP